VPLAEERERLGIPGLGSEATHNFRDKARMKSVLRAAGVPCARHGLAGTVAEAQAFADAVGFPLVVKPPAGAGSVATFRAGDARELADALAAAPPTPDRPVLLEEFVTGEEHSLETISIDGRAVWHSLTRYRPTPLEVVRNPWIQWCIVLPREVDDPRYDDIKAVGADALRALGMTTGLSHMEWFRRADGSVAIGEVGARPPGAQITTLVSRATDTDFVRTWAELMVFGTFTPPTRSTRPASPSCAPRATRAAACAPCTASTASRTRPRRWRSTGSSRSSARRPARRTRATAGCWCGIRRRRRWSGRCRS
jgi:biotin carboxylase